jgi:hypothetical protein
MNPERSSQCSRNPPLAPLFYLKSCELVAYYLLQVLWCKSRQNRDRWWQMDGPFFVVVSTYKPAHGGCGRGAGRSGGLWLNDHTPTPCTLYTREVNLGDDPGVRYFATAALVPASHWRLAVGGGFCMKTPEQVMSWSTINSFYAWFLTLSMSILNSLQQFNYIEISEEYISIEITF